MRWRTSAARSRRWAPPVVTADRTEAAAKAVVDHTLERGSVHLNITSAVAVALAAADAHDRANSIARIRLDDELAEKIAQAIHDDECSEHHDPNDCWTECLEWERDIYRRIARAVLDLLRNEAL